ncbi:S41 family peptidase [Myxococcus sp. CA018]|uniref:S41 family peptidase n=1 Tax=Myxococcus sp. CA018 TaxID=2651864 RepID=UPI001F08AECB|nr:S41 family peptidase [Myxococcus sp. CA018]
MATLKDIQLAGITLKNVPTVFDDAGKSVSASDRLLGNMGLAVLARFRMITDYATDTLMLVPDARALRQPFLKDRSGLIALPSEGRLVVKLVAPGSPAASSGWKVGDEIVAIDGKPIGTDYAGTEAARWRCRAAGQTVVLTLKDGSKRRLTLRDYYCAIVARSTASGPRGLPGPRGDWGREPCSGAPARDITGGSMPSLKRRATAAPTVHPRHGVAHRVHCLVYPLIAVCCVVLSATPATACPSGELEPRQAREDLELAISAVEAAIPDLLWRQSPREWARRKAQARALAAKVTTEEALFRALRPLLSGIGEGHLSVARSPGMNCRYREHARLFPLDLLWRDDGMFVIAGYGAASDIPPGTRLLSINGEGRKALLAEMMRVSPHDGAIETGVMRDRGGAGYARVRWWMRGDEAGYDVHLRLPDGKAMRRRLEPVTVATRPPPSDDASPLATLSWVDDTTAYLHVPTFSNRRYREAGAAFEPTMRAHFEALVARGARNLILDLRDNGGGSEPNESILFSHLVTEPLQKYASVRTRPNHLRVTTTTGRVFEHEIYDAEELATVQARADGHLLRINAPPEGLMTRWSRAQPVFEGRLVVLAGGATFSGGAELASMLRATERGLFVGEEVGGTYGGNTSGYKWDLVLPHSGMELGIPLLAFRFVWPEPQPHRGAMPHCPVQPSVGEKRVENDAAYRIAVQALQRSWTRPSRRVCS